MTKQVHVTLYTGATGYLMLRVNDQITLVGGFQVNTTADVRLLRRQQPTSIRLETRNRSTVVEIKKSILRESMNPE